ncbi:hypothetical protein PISMIDRAFT_121432, partial [Pisolithus microcarpus 441]
VWAVAFVDESQVVTGDENGGIRRWRIEGGQQQGQTMQAGRRVHSITVSQDGRWIVSGDLGHKAILWNAATHEKVLDITHNNSVNGVDISSNCTKFVAADCSVTDNVQLFGITSGHRLLPPLSHCHNSGVKFSPDGSRFATSSYGYGKITCLNVSNSSSSEWPIHETQSSASIASNGIFIACSAGKSVSLWDCASHEQIGSIITHTTEIRCVALSPSGGYLACGVGYNITIHDLGGVLPSKYFVRGVSELRHCAT